MSLSDRIHQNFTYHPPEEHQVSDFVSIREYGKSLALHIDRLVPDGREKSVALTKLEEVVMWANAGIARQNPV